jgi:hypothetical protein
MTALQIEFGHGHPLIESYIRAQTTCARALTVFPSGRRYASFSEEQQKKLVEKSARAMVDAQRARSVWGEEARQVIDAI